MAGRDIAYKVAPQGCVFMELCKDPVEEGCGNMALK